MQTTAPIAETTEKKGEMRYSRLTLGGEVLGTMTRDARKASERIDRQWRMEMCRSEDEIAGQSSLSLSPPIVERKKESIGDIVKVVRYDFQIALDRNKTEPPLP